MPAWIGLQPVRRQVAIYGKVSDAQTGLPIQGALVEMEKIPETFKKWLALRSIQYGSDWDKMTERPDRIRTAADGYFHFLDLPDGEYTLKASLPGAGTRYGTAQVTVTVRREEGGKIARNSADMALPPTAIKGHIAAGDKSAVFMAKIQIEGSAEPAFSDSKGNYLLSGLEAGKQGAKRTVNLRVSASGCQPVSQIAEISQGEVTVLDWELV
ncbi:MSCRAMM family protein [Kamptonema formosum]|uniref:MSCRAMM family protein n=1 Tax=Kamptonema formosum TaxID=331992 RepID=UPI00034A7753|nr:carboxypeptidase regulatory-like domain-containing protein [Oscillatoria sp. PCC 10802]